MTNANARTPPGTSPELTRDDLIARVVAALEQSEPLTFDEATEVALPHPTRSAHLLAAWEIYRHDIGRGRN
jgi:hypothetical protein